MVIITSGVPRKPGQTRIDLAQTNVNVIKSIAPSIVPYAPNAFYLLVSNPVDILTYVFQKVSGIPEERMVRTVAEHGNTSAASVPLALDRAVRAGMVKPGELVLLQGVGAGMAWGSALIRW